MITIENLNKITQWQKTLKKNNKRQEKKDRIQQAFTNNVKVDVIPAKTIDSHDNDKPLRVAAYCRVSTYEEAQAGSFELQVQYYNEKINSNQKWNLVDIYADEGVSGTTIKKRRNFIRMIDDCLKGKIDLILTKSVSRFSRNTLDHLSIIRQLRTLNSPVGVHFETEGINTLDSQSETFLTMLSAIAQEESERKSAAIKWAITERFRKGIPVISTHNLLGFDKDSNGKIIIADEEADIVRYIYNNFINGVTTKDIADSLTKAEIPTITGKFSWKSEGIRRILRNEKYCGDVLMQKTYTVDCLSHKSRKNTGQKQQYFVQNVLPAIISKDKWYLVQKLLKNRRTQKPLPEKLKEKVIFKRVKINSLKGFIYINTNWSQEDINYIIERLTIKSQ